jgi:hypothetical protein
MAFVAPKEERKEAMNFITGSSLMNFHVQVIHESQTAGSRPLLSCWCMELDSKSRIIQSHLKRSKNKLKAKNHPIFQDFRRA